MQNLFLGLLAALIAFSQYINYKFDQKYKGGELPVIYWVTDANPARTEQVALFRSWLKKRGYKDIDLRVDVNSQGVNKTIIQGVTGVAGDCIDAGSTWFRYFYNMGIIRSVTNLEARFGYPDSGLFPSLLADILADGKQIAFPCNLGIAGYLVNVDAFRRLKMEPPSFLMDFDAFERHGKEFVSRANAGKRRDVFYAASINQEAMRRSLGVSYFNETLTASGGNRREFVRALKLNYKWVYEDHLAPTAAEMASFATEYGYGGLSYQLLNKGNFGMVDTGRWAMIQMRQMANRPEWAQIVYPHGGFPNVFATTRAAVLYAGSHQTDAAIHFLGFLRSDEYNMHVVNDSDGIPPNPKFMDREEFLRPKGHTNEWAMQSACRDIANQYAWPRDITPYAQYQKYSRVENLSIQSFMNNLMSAEEAVATIDKALNEHIASFMKVHHEMKTRYEEALARQKIIDTAKAAGKKIPLALVDNPFLKAYYKKMGLGE
jgi:multiple sugar transport system substrate-binding protein